MSDLWPMEEKLAHLQRTVDELSDVVATQANIITQMRRQLDLLLQREAQREAEGGGGIVLGDERPPHY